MTKRKSPRVFTEVFKLEVLRDYYSSGMGIMPLCRKWQISHASFYQWQKRWPADSKELSLPMETLSKLPKPMLEKSKEDLLNERIASLERALAFEKMRSRAFEKMIEIAEAEEGISILKKDGAKQ